MHIPFQSWKRKEALRERDYVVRNRDNYVARERDLREVYRRGEPIRVWSDETYVNKNYVKKQCLCDDKMVVNQPSGVGPRWNVIHWMAELDAWVKLLVGRLSKWVAEKRTGDFHIELGKN